MRNFGLICITIVCLTFQIQADAAIDAKLLKEAGLETAWQSAVSLNPNESVERVTVLGDYLYILTSSNYLFCLDRNSGKLVFGISAAKAKLPVSEPVDFNNAAYMIAGNELLAVDLRSGTETYRKKLEYPAAARPAINDTYFYIAGMDKSLHAADCNAHDIFKVNPDDKTTITSVIISDNSSVVFATVGGKVFCMDSNKPVKRWRFDTVGAIEAPVVNAGSAIYVSGKDTNLYKLSADTGKQEWKIYTGAFLTTSARVTQTTVYQYATNKGLYAIDANSGKQLWLLPEGTELLAQNGNTAYVFDKNNVCVVMDNTKAGKVYTVNFASVTSCAANPYDAKIYVMEGKNISCIQPIIKK